MSIETSVVAFCMLATLASWGVDFDAFDSPETAVLFDSSDIAAISKASVLAEVVEDPSPR